MRDVEGMEYAQISEVLELPLGTVKSRLFRARLALRQELMEYMEVKEVGIGLPARVLKIRKKDHGLVARATEKHEQ